jgi:hypothetical protein
MSRVVFLIDGFNLYHALDYNPAPFSNPFRYRKHKWLDLRGLAELYTANEPGDTLEAV